MPRRISYLMGEGSDLWGCRMGRHTADGLKLSYRERQIAAGLALGLSDKELAAQIGISTNTIRTHLKRLYVGLGVRNRTQAVAVLAAYEADSSRQIPRVSLQDGVIGH